MESAPMLETVLLQCLVGKFVTLKKHSYEIVLTHRLVSTIIKQ